MLDCIGNLVKGNKYFNVFFIDYLVIYYDIEVFDVGVIDRLCIIEARTHTYFVNFERRFHYFFFCATFNLAIIALIFAKAKDVCNVTIDDLLKVCNLFSF